MYNKQGRYDRVIELWAALLADPSGMMPDTVTCNNVLIARAARCAGDWFSLCISSLFLPLRISPGLQGTVCPFLLCLCH
jgi:hypothetical protein